MPVAGAIASRRGGAAGTSPVRTLLRAGRVRKRSRSSAYRSRGAHRGLCGDTQSVHRVAPTLPTSRRTNAPNIASHQRSQSGIRRCAAAGRGIRPDGAPCGCRERVPSSHTKLVAAAPPVQGPARGLLDPCRAPDAGTRPRQRGHDNSAATERARRSFATKVPGSGDAVRVCGPRRISGAAPPRRRARAVTYALPGVCVRRSSAPGNRYGAAACLTAACGPASSRWHRTAGPRRCSACNGAARRNLLDSNGGMPGA